MDHKPWILYTETDKALMWNRCQQGDSLHASARLLARIQDIEDRLPFALQ